MATRIEKDSLGELEVPAEAYYGVHTCRSLKNFDAAGEPIPIEMIHGMAKLKWACAKANNKLGLLPEGVASNSDSARADTYLGLREDFRAARQRFEHLYFSQLLERCDGNLSEAARVAKLNRGHLYTKLSELGLKK